MDIGQQRRFRDLVAERLGLNFEEARLEFLGGVLQRRTDALGMPVEVYLAAIGDNAAETGALAEELTVGETYFFRDGDQFRALGEIVLPALLRQTPHRPLNILSAGCSSGEEAYSVAMVADAAAARVAIRAVDVNPAALRKALAARYGSWSLRETPPYIQQRWFARRGRDMVLSDEVRRAVQFEHCNLIDAQSDVWRPQAYDVVFCRNVIMYFSPATQRVIVDRITESLVSGGYLFLGHAETLRGLSEEFSLVQSHGTFYYELKSGAAHRPRRRAEAGRAVGSAAIAGPPAEIDTGWYDTIGGASRRIEALSRSAKAALSAPPANWDIETAFELLRHEHFAEALELVGGAPPEQAGGAGLRLLRATLLVQGGQLGAAAADCRALLASGEFEAEANHVLALCHEGSGQIEDALRCYGAAAGLDPQFAMPRLRAGILARRSGRLEEAQAFLSQAADLLEQEEESRLLLFSGGFARASLLWLCAAELRACEAAA